MTAFDAVISKRIKMGRFQTIMLLSIGLMHLLASAEIVITQILMSVLKKDWELSEFQVMLLPFTNYVGLLFGAMTCSFVSNYTGRKNLLIVFALLQILALIWNTSITLYISLIVIIFIYGAIYGLVGPIGNILLTEVSPESQRGKVVIYQQIMMVCGLVLGACLCFVFMEDFGNGNWQGLIYAHVVPAIIAVFCIMIFTNESPKFYISLSLFTKGFKILNTMGYINNEGVFQVLSPNEKDSLVCWKNINQQENSKQEGIMGLFEPGQASITIRCWILFSLFEFHRSMQYLMPLYFYDMNSGFEALLFPYLAELGGISIILIFIGENQKDRPRQIMMIVLTIVILMVVATLFYFKSAMVIIFFMINRATQRINLACLYIIGTSSFSVLQVSAGLGTSLALGRVSGAFISFFLVWSKYTDERLPFIELAIVSGLMILVVYGLKPKLQK